LGPCQEGNEPSCSIKERGALKQFSDYQLLKDSVYAVSGNSKNPKRKINKQVNKISSTRNNMEKMLFSNTRKDNYSFT
jgi:hypothetical protein